MKVRDKKIKKDVDVSCKDCINRECYWPRPNPGAFNVGRGYSLPSGYKIEYLCGTREIKGCPDKFCTLSKP